MKIELPSLLEIMPYFVFNFQDFYSLLTDGIGPTPISVRQNGDVQLGGIKSEDQMTG